MPTVHPWTLVIDFGTTTTVAVAEVAGRMDAVVIDGSESMPSAVLRDASGVFVVGASAEAQAALDPDRFEPSPKRRLGEEHLLLGPSLVAVLDLVAAVLSRVAAQACAMQGGPPTELRLTYPARWSHGVGKQTVLAGAAAKAGLPKPVFVPEPVAAVHFFTATHRPLNPGEHAAVYDLGGGTFDCAVITATPSGLALAGAPGGIDPLGGEDFDHAVLNHLATRLPADVAARLTNPPDTTWRRHAREFRRAARRAKEELSGASVATVYVPGANTDVQITRGEFDELIRPAVEATLAELEDVLTRAGVRAEDLAGLYLAGGSSRIPLIATSVWKRFGLTPLTSSDPKASTARGAALHARHQATTTAAPALPPTPPPPPPPAPPPQPQQRGAKPPPGLGPTVLPRADQPASSDPRHQQHVEHPPWEQPGRQPWGQGGAAQPWGQGRAAQPGGQGGAAQPWPGRPPTPGFHTPPAPNVAALRADPSWPLVEPHAAQWLSTQLGPDEDFVALAKCLGLERFTSLRRVVSVALTSERLLAIHATKQVHNPIAFPYSELRVHSLVSSGVTARVVVRHAEGLWGFAAFAAPARFEHFADHLLGRCR